MGKSMGWAGESEEAAEVRYRMPASTILVHACGPRACMVALVSNEIVLLPSRFARVAAKRTRLLANFSKAATLSRFPRVGTGFGLRRASIPLHCLLAPRLRRCRSADATAAQV